ncbi:MAG: hypothetical protein D5R97_05945 [Candidatus Syntrophonatronum acetioxidans]|uniref:NodB homology domain-containing protein n=1 Tax=Candidatus Syntrophonatronum acetioxidans TaxID=1795816 RepID=A0A424YD93_9FIRM|nr:MAG: hypothetical protein D5R97_05945 [Candidatus Syntrophonatronum acetioxidans]
MKRYAIFKTIPGIGTVVVIIFAVLLLTLLMLKGSSQGGFGEKTVQEGVTFLKKDLSGKVEEEVRLIIELARPLLERDPVNAYIDPETKGVIPELLGYKIDATSSLERILEASEGEEVYPLIKKISPDITINDFPDAPLYQGNPEKKKIAFLINVAWGDEYLEDMLEVLEANQVSSTFFFVGKWMEKNSGMVQEIYRRGHEVANHGYRDTVLMSQLSLEEVKEDIIKTNLLIKDLTGEQARYFSSHCGELNKDILEAAAELGMRAVMWSLDTVDWKLPGEENMAEKILTNSHPGATVLMHPTPQTPGALALIIKGLKEQGYELVNLTRLIDPDYCKVLQGTGQ